MGRKYYRTSLEPKQDNSRLQAITEKELEQLVNQEVDATNRLLQEVHEQLGGSADSSLILGQYRNLGKHLIQQERSESPSEYNYFGSVVQGSTSNSMIYYYNNLKEVQESIVPQSNRIGNNNTKAKRQDIRAKRDKLKEENNEITANWKKLGQEDKRLREEKKEINKTIAANKREIEELKVEAKAVEAVPEVGPALSKTLEIKQKQLELENKKLQDRKDRIDNTLEQNKEERNNLRRQREDNRRSKEELKKETEQIREIEEGQEGAKQERAERKSAIYDASQKDKLFYDEYKQNSNLTAHEFAEIIWEDYRNSGIEDSETLRQIYDEAYTYFQEKQTAENSYQLTPDDFLSGKEISTGEEIPITENYIDPREEISQLFGGAL